jgi:hypothetical protein
VGVVPVVEGSWRKWIVDDGVVISRGDEVNDLLGSLVGLMGGDQSEGVGEKHKEGNSSEHCVWEQVCSGCTNGW